MFTGIITNIGIINNIETKSCGHKVFKIECDFDFEGLNVGASVCVEGVCLTVVNKQKLENKKIICTFDVSIETLKKSNLLNMNIDDRVNLERALTLGEELGGHLVLGHIDCTAEILNITIDADSFKFLIGLDAVWMKYIAPKGSVVINGISLTVNETLDNSFWVNVIPHTMNNTTLNQYKKSHMLNI